MSDEDLRKRRTAIWRTVVAVALVAQAGIVAVLFEGRERAGVEACVDALLSVLSSK